MTIICGDCLDVIKTFPDNHFSCIVTDPPYFIEFMGKEFDKFEGNIAKSPELWKEALRITKPGGHLLAFGGDRTHHHLMIALENAGWTIRTCIYWITGQGFPKSHNHFGLDGYGTALKPAAEIIIMAMKKCDGTFKQNAEKWGQAGINIAASRIGCEEHSYSPRLTKNKNLNDDGWNKIGISSDKKTVNGRWPSNLLLDEEATAQLGSPSRFFYVAKASSSERNAGLEERSTHPTIKPLRLMQYLIKLVMPPSNGLLLDPFAGSGSTIVAAKQLGFQAIGIEKSEEYCEIARKRVEHVKINDQMDLFNEETS